MKTGEKWQATSLKRYPGRAAKQVPTRRAAVAPAECCHFASLGSSPKISPQKFRRRYFEKVTLGWWYLKLLRCSADSTRRVQGVDAGRLCSATLTKRTHQTLFRLEQRMAAGRMVSACFLAVREEGRGLKGRRGSFSHVRKCVEWRKNCHSFWLHARRICKPGFTSSEFLSQAYVFLLCVRGKPLAWCARENLTHGCFKNAAIYFCETDWN